MISMPTNAVKKYHTSHYKGLGGLKNDFRNRNLVNLIASKVKGKTILDIGCGNGYLLHILHKKGKEIFGIEPNEELIKIAKKINPELHILQGFAEDANKFKRKVDTITMVDVLEHIEHDNLLLKKIYNALNDKGQLVLVTPAFQFLYGKRDINNGHYRRYSKRDLAKKLAKAGFKIRHIRYWNALGFFPYFFYEKVLGKELNTALRTEKKTGALNSVIRNLLDVWFRDIENNFDFGFGLSIVCIAEKLNYGKD